MNPGRGTELLARSFTALEEIALQRLNLCGTRLIPHSGAWLIGYWPDLDSIEFRDALRHAGVQMCELVDLNSADVPVAYRLRSCPVRRPSEPFKAWERRAQAQRQKEAA